jgi:hypothetical protein
MSIFRDDHSVARQELLEPLRQQALAARDSLSRLIDGNSSSGA